jgi:hypothetical protein
VPDRRHQLLVRVLPRLCVLPANYALTRFGPDRSLGWLGAGCGVCLPRICHDVRELEGRGGY